MDDVVKLKETLARFGLTPNRALGQNFLVDAQAAAAILDAADVSAKRVLEIGPGAGALTQELLARASRVAAVEIDTNMARILRDRFGEALLLYEEDFLKTDLHAVYHALGDAPLHVVGNLPYYITTPICMRLLTCELPIASMTFMVQQEAAARFFAGPGDKVYGPMAILTQAYYQPSRILTLSPDSFYPQPDVSSAVVHLTRNERAYLPNLPTLLKCCFAMRRKTIANNLKAYQGEVPTQAALAACRIAPGARAEALCMEQFIDLCAHL